MNMQTAVKTVLGKYATFSGRAPRSEYWWYFLAFLILVIGLSVIDGTIVLPALGFEPYAKEGGSPLATLVSLGLLLPTLAVSVRRLHDTDRSGWWYFVGIVPVIGSLVLLYFFVQQGTEGTNQFDEEQVNRG